MHDLCLPSLVSKRPVWDTFPGAWYTKAADVVMPNGRTLQVATYHHYKDQWANAFDLSYEDPEGNTKPCHQTTFGMSERLLGAVVGMHGDDKGLILPPAVAPIQVVVMPIAAHADSKVEPAAQALAARLSASGIRVELDTRDVRPGVKHYDWEIKGVPIRIELGPRDLSAGKFVLTLRTGSKSEISIDEAEKSVLESLEGLAEDLRQRAKSLVSEKVQPFPFDNLDYDTSQESSIESGIVYQIAFEGNDSDAEFLEKKTGLTLLGECDDEFPEERNCLITGKATKKMQHIGRMY
jgi:prolyl-tRNA synthetase